MSESQSVRNQQLVNIKFYLAFKNQKEFLELIKGSDYRIITIS